MASEDANQDATTVSVTVERRLDAPPEVVWDSIGDISVTRAMLPGCEKLDFGVDRDYVEAGDEGTATIAIGIGPISPSFETDVEVLRRDYPEMAITASGSAAGSTFDTTADLSLAATDGGEQTDVTWDATAAVTGRVETFSGALKPVVAEVAQRFFEQLDDHVTDRTEQSD